MPEFMTEWWFLILMFVSLLGLLAAVPILVVVLFGMFFRKRADGDQPGTDR